MSMILILTMNQYTTKERATIVALYIETNRLAVKKVRSYRMKLTSPSVGVHKQNCRIWGTENPYVIHGTSCTIKKPMRVVI